MNTSTHTSMRTTGLSRRRGYGAVLALAWLVVSGPALAQMCARTLTADVVLFDQPLMFNRLGAQNVNGMMYALRRDVINMTSGEPLTPGGAATPGDVALRPDKSPRPLVLRVRVGDCLTVRFQNLLTPAANPFDPPENRSGMPFTLVKDNQVKDRRASFHVTGMQLVGSIADDGSNVGKNANSVVDVGKNATYKLYAEKEGQFVINSYGVTFGGEGQGGNTAGGLFGELIVEPKNAAIYRGQLTREEMDLAMTGYTTDGHPILDYEATYPTDSTTPTVWDKEGKGGLPIINMIDGVSATAGEIVHSDINAVVAYGPKGTIDASPSRPEDFTDGNGNGVWDDGEAFVDVNNNGLWDDETNPHVGKVGHFPPETYPLESVGKRNPTVPNRLEPFRDFASIFHDEVATAQMLPLWYNDPVLGHTLHGVRDSFMINYRSGGIGSEIIANRLGVGPMYDCVNCAYEEFFLASSTVGDPGLLVDVPANAGLEDCAPDLSGCLDVGPKASYAMFPEDPANVHHSYTGDFVKFRNVHAGPAEQHIFHLHNHQWLFNANDDNSNYIDAQGLGPGSGYTYEINFGGSGNRNKTAGDAIFHCHFYPHFAQGMWYLWRVHDVFENGTILEASGSGIHKVPFALADGTPAMHPLRGNGYVPADSRVRALPDGEITVGTPIPGVVPLPGKPMAPMPGDVAIVAKDAGGPLTPGVPDGIPDSSQVKVVERTINPGFPFWIAGVEHTVGQRPTTPVLDMLTKDAAAALEANPDGVLGTHPGFAAAADGWDGGLPRFTMGGYLEGSASVQIQTRLDFSKEITKVKPYFYPETGTDLERVHMAFQAKRCHDSFQPDGTPADCAGPDFTGDGLADEGGFVTNGQPPVSGAPYYEPCIDDRGTLLTAKSTGTFFSGDTLTGMNTAGNSNFNAEYPRIYKAANVQFDVVLNKLGYHFPQHRVLTLWQDVIPTIEKRRPPEPFVMRLNTFDCANYHHTNLVPKVYELDDYQVRTPTDVIGQHIHLPKWDLVSADGSANGWNYEDGTLSPQMTVELIEAINAYNTNLANTPVTVDVEGNPVVNSAGYMLSPSNPELHPLAHPFFGETSLAERWLGARTTIQRWFADPVVNVGGIDRGLGIIFTHDHFGPSTHQQAGLYATVLTEPAGSVWAHNETGEQLGDVATYGDSGRIDGGPTSWQAAIITQDNGLSEVGAGELNDFREFYFEYSDFQHAYEKGVYVGIGPDGLPINAHDPVSGYISTVGLKDGAPLAAAETFRFAMQPAVREGVAFPDILVSAPECPGGAPRPCPEAITADDPGMMVVNYRNEPLLPRVYDPDKIGPDGVQGAQADGKAGDLAFALESRSDRAIPELNDKLGYAPAGYAGDPSGEVFLPPITQLSALSGGDPFTPMARAYTGDEVHIKMQAGGSEEEHASTVHGLKWLQGGSGHGKAGNSGWRNSQTSGISEQFTLNMPVFFDKNAQQSSNDYLYSHDASVDGWAAGVWGILRDYRSNQNDLFALPDNPAPAKLGNTRDFNGVCPASAPLRTYAVTAVLANDVLPNPGVTLTKAGFEPAYGLHAGGALDPSGGTLVYNSRTTSVSGVVDGAMRTKQGPLHDPTAILYAYTNDLQADDYDPETGTSSDPRCLMAPRKAGGKWKYTPHLPTCPVALKPEVAVEPLVLRAAAGECVEVTLSNKLLAQAVDADGDAVYDLNGETMKPAFEDRGHDLYKDDGITPAMQPVTFDRMPDLPNRNPLQLTQVRERNLGNANKGVTWFGNNHVRPSAHVGMHAALVEYDISRDDGVIVGQNNQDTIVPPGGQHTYRWYAGHLEPTPGTKAGQINLVATPVEFGGFNIAPADKIKQHQKGMVAAGAVYPEGSTWTVDAGTHAAATVTKDGDSFRDFTTVWQKNLNFYWADGDSVYNTEAEDFGVTEDPEDAGHMAINYATEPAWFRFGMLPCSEGACENVPNAYELYANARVSGDPETPVFTAAPGEPFRMHMLMPAGSGRKSAPTLHGHVWQRDPYTCPGSADAGLPGKCYTDEVGSRSMGENPIGFAIGGIQSFEPGAHFEIYSESAGGTNKVLGDYLFRDHMGLGNLDGLWGILRVGGPVADPPPDTGGGGGGGGGGKGKGKKK